MKTKHPSQSSPLDRNPRRKFPLLAVAAMLAPLLGIGCAGPTEVPTAPGYQPDGRALGWGHSEGRGISIVPQPGYMGQTMVPMTLEPYDVPFAP